MNDWQGLLFVAVAAVAAVLLSWGTKVLSGIDEPQEATERRRGDASSLSPMAGPTHLHESPAGTEVWQVEARLSTWTGRDSASLDLGPQPSSGAR